MLIKFSQKWAKAQYEKKIRELIHFVKGRRNCPDLLIKVFFYKSKSASWKAHYHSAVIHGFYDSEREYVAKGYVHIITLKIGEDFTDRSFVWAFAHEFKHYLDFREKLDKKRYKWWEKRANKFANKKVEEWNNANTTQAEAQDHQAASDK